MLICYYSMKILFIIALSLKISTLFTILCLFIPALFIIHTGINFFLFSKFPSHEGKGSGGPILDIECNTTM